MVFINSTLNRKHLAWVLLLLFFSCTQAEEYVEGRHYQILDNPTVTRNPSKVEVVEVFWFGCNHCYSLESYIQPWKRNLPNDVDFWKSHITWNAQAETHARLFYSAKALGIEEKAIPAAFTAIWREGRNLLGNSEVEYFFKGFGIEKERYLSVSNSFGVNNAVKQANNRMRQWTVTGVPTIIVNGKYKVSGTREIGTSKLLDVVDFLIEKERRFLTRSD
ncbi:MAG: thiol:disulfide interchange protein DsbA [Gammaproteobacteria bacterium]|jgi:thiol:disulfide interchange protein DsbA|nr:MAG: thiol:disulfide interchange protein DsbA [Gammaproteobacteria bacterium]|tara:strand:- start:213 stop:869 length:657 start_codon:yes stop_codon:yes gene_type:complete